MKVAVYTEEGVTQIFLTPQNEWEKKVAQQVMNHDGKLSVFRGSFYECRGGYLRYEMRESADDSVLLRLDAPATPVRDPGGEEG